jgi:putative NADPH-quinone reductase
VKVLLASGFSDDNLSDDKAILGAAQAALIARGHDVSALELISAGFGYFLSADERRAYHEIDNLVTPEQRESAALVQSHDAILVCGPLVQGTIAPCVKSWFERVFIPEVAFTFNKAGRVTGALSNVRRVGMIVDCPERDDWAHGRRGSTRSAIRGVRMMSARTCRTTYLAVLPEDDVTSQVTKALARW